MTNKTSARNTLLAIGLDATDIPRIDSAIKRFGDRFLQRIFTQGEITYCLKRRNPVPSFAARFAAKEAAMKALGTGHSNGILWKDIEVVRFSGPPSLLFHRAAQRRLHALGAQTSFLTLTHSDKLAMAQVVLLS